MDGYINECHMSSAMIPINGFIASQFAQYRTQNSNPDIEVGHNKSIKKNNQYNNIWMNNSRLPNQLNIQYWMDCGVH